MTKMAGGTLLMIMLAVGVMLTWVGGAAAATPISSCGFVITVPGTYVLTANLASAGGNNCITVAADNVTIDFDGFVIDGDGGDGTGVTDGEVSRKSIALRNGMIRGKAGGSIGIAIYLSQTTMSRWMG